MIVPVPGAGQAPRIRQRQGVGPGGGHEVARLHRVHEAEGGSLLGAHRIAGQRHGEGLLRPDQAGQALRAPGPGNEAELDLGQAELRRRRGDAGMAGERQFEAAAKGHAVDRCHDGLRGAVDPGQDVGQDRRAGRLAELGDVRPSDEQLARRRDDDAADRLVGQGRAQAFVEGGAKRGAQGVDGGIREGEHGDAAVVVTLNHRLPPVPLSGISFCIPGKVLPGIQRCQGSA